MGHNISDRRAREMELAERSRAVAGWVLRPDGKVEQPQTPAALAARRAVLLGRCGKRPDCGRRVTFDAALWCARGHATTPLKDLLETYRCGLIPCRLDWAPERYPSGLPLGAWLAIPEAQVVVACSCQGFKPQRLPVQTFARRVVESLGPAALAIPAAPARPPEPVALSPSLIRGPCPCCRESRWRIRLHPPAHRTA